MLDFRCVAGLVPAVLFAAVAPAQVSNPVPTRLAVAHYGFYDGFSQTLALECNLRAPIQSEIRLSGGTWGDPACVLLDTQAQAVKWPWGVLAVTPNALALGGLFGPTGEFCLPVDLARTDLVGHSFFLQGVGVSMWPLWDVQFTRGFEMTFHPGNAQPPLSYDGPALTAILCRDGEPNDPPVHELLLSFAVPYLGYEAELVRSVFADGVTRAFVRLTPPAPAGDLKLWPNNVRMVVALGTELAHNLEVYVDHGHMDPGYSDRVNPFELAAMIVTDY